MTKPMGFNSNVLQAHPLSKSPFNWNWLGFTAFFCIFILEFTTPSAFIFGYLYTAPILLASAYSKRNRTMPATSLAILLTLLNIWLPNHADTSLAMIANRVIASMALLVTGVLSDRNRYYQEAIVQQQAQIATNEKSCSFGKILPLPSPMI
ncbi:MAG: hypothetical protein HC929_07580 [Leptolyngbyaceae cyanobacterium SM2_5_2]|nr:hypothetical protein [Leptolyngbyaceae cyanobacterium SM2_5_2]